MSSKNPAPRHAHKNRLLAALLRCFPVLSMTVFSVHLDGWPLLFLPVWGVGYLYLGQWQRFWRAVSAALATSLVTLVAAACYALAFVDTGPLPNHKILEAGILGLLVAASDRNNLEDRTLNVASFGHTFVLANAHTAHRRPRESSSSNAFHFSLLLDDDRPLHERMQAAGVRAGVRVFEGLRERRGRKQDPTVPPPESDTTS
jgi:hypothetical protein